jgi:hypothetical protein
LLSIVAISAVDSPASYSVSSIDFSLAPAMLCVRHVVVERDREQGAQRHVDAAENVILGGAFGCGHYRLLALLAGAFFVAFFVALAGFLLPFALRAADRFVATVPDEVSIRSAMSELLKPTAFRRTHLSTFDASAML